MTEVKRLPELSEHDAGDTITAIYEEIKACCRVPMVALIYRHLATHDGLLEWSWRVLAPAMRSGALSAAAQEAAAGSPGISMPALTPDAAEALGLAPMDISAIAYIITAYNTANPHNIIAVRVLMNLLATEPAQGRTDAETGAETGQRGAPVRYPALPPLVQLEEMPPALAARLGRLRVSGDDGSRGIVPTLYRHLGHWPDYLSASAAALEPLFRSGEIATAAGHIASAADAAAARLGAHDSSEGRPTGAAREALLATLGGFAATIPEMIVVGRLLAAALPRD